MTADMAEKLTGEAHAGQILSGLNKNNYFCQRHVGAGSKPAPAYCYHPLFREFLLAKAKKTYSGDVCAKMRRETALLLAEAGRIEEAAKLLQEAKDFASLAEHVLRHAPSLLAQGRNKTLDEWLACIPRHEMESDPYLLQYAGLCRLPFDFRESRNLLQKSFHLLNARKEYPAALFVAA
jgi:ATP/maltotriose-dependent transcriptional regulator MalT